MRGSNYLNCLNDMFDLPVFYWNSSDGDKENKTLCRTDSDYSPNKVKTWDRELKDFTVKIDSAVENAYEVIFANDETADGILIYFDKNDLPKSELTDQDGIVRISELMLTTDKGEKLF